MNKRIVPVLLAAALLLGGCGWMDGSYVYVEPHVEQGYAAQTGDVSAGDYSELLQVMVQLVSTGTESCTIDIDDFYKDEPERYVEAVCHYIQNSNPIGAYAVEDIAYEIGTNNGREAIAVELRYRRSRTEIQRIRKVSDMEHLAQSVFQALADHSGQVVYLVASYSEMDFRELAQRYAREEPQSLMEIPQISEGIYGNGDARVVELTFTYQNSREALRQMQAQVRPVFEAASLYVSGEGSEHQKFSQLYGFLTERFEYKLDTSITPAYSLLCHGVGDSSAFAEVYAAMCRRAGLECLIVNGTRDGEPWTWNMVLDAGNYYHVDLLRKSGDGDFREYSDGEMTGYVWDYSAYPACSAAYEEPAAPSPEPGVPQETTPPVPGVPGETVPESIPPQTEETLPPESEETVPPQTEETVPPQTEETVPEETAPQTEAATPEEQSETE